MRNLILVVLLLAFMPAALFSQTSRLIKLSDLDLTKAGQSYGMPRKNLSVTGEPLSVAGQAFQTGVGVQADSKITLSLVGNTNSIRGYVGINDCSVDYNDPSLIRTPLADGTMVFYSSIESGKEFLGLGEADGTQTGGSVIFRIMGDGKELFCSGMMHRGDAPKEFDLRVRGIRLLELIAESTEDGPVVKEFLSSKISALPEVSKDSILPEKDWLIDNRSFLSFVGKSSDGKDWDGIMHVNPTLEDKGFVMLYNPLDEDITRTVTLPLYYTGITRKATVSEQDKKAVKVTLDREYKIQVKVTIPANGYNWFVIR